MSSSVFPEEIECVDCGTDFEIRPSQHVNFLRGHDLYCQNCTKERTYEDMQ